jgi:hypothetical protein
VPLIESQQAAVALPITFIQKRPDIFIGINNMSVHIIDPPVGMSFVLGNLIGTGQFGFQHHSISLGQYHFVGAQRDGSPPPSGG